MLNRSASLMMSTSVLKALPGKLDIKRHSPSILYVYDQEINVMLIDQRLACATKRKRHKNKYKLQRHKNRSHECSSTINFI